MSNIVERLRERHSLLCDEAADEIERLRREVVERNRKGIENERLRGLLLQFVEYVEQDTEWPDIVADARAALAGAGSEMELVYKRQAEIDGCCPSCGRSTKRHPGYVIGNHWLETAYERICAGEAEDDVLRDYDVVMW